MTTKHLVFPCCILCEVHKMTVYFSHSEHNEDTKSIEFVYAAVCVRSTHTFE